MFGAEKAFQSAVSVSSKMAKRFHTALTEAGVTCIIAPYEADAQMAKMVIQGLADAAGEGSRVLLKACIEMRGE